MYEDSESGGSGSTSASPSLLSNLRQFRYQKKAVSKIETSKSSRPTSPLHTEEAPCSLNSPEIKVAQPRKKVRRLEVSDEDEEEPITNTELCDEASANVTEANLQFLQDAFPDKDKMELQDALASSGWDAEAAMSLLCKSPSKNNHINEHTRTKEHNPKHRKKLKRRRLVLGSSSDGEDQYQDDCVFDSSDSDPDLDDSQLKQSHKDVLMFLSTATEGELRAMPKSSVKKVKVILQLRPFDSWRDLVEKLQKNRGVGCSDILNAANTVLKSREVVTKLMKKCVQLATQMERAVEDGALHVTKQPRSIPSGLELANYQLVGLNWLISIHNLGLNGILADEMGLGKTVQVIAFLAHLQETGEAQDGPHLIVVPASTLDNWNNELARWCPSLRVVLYYGSQDERRDLRMSWNRGGLEDVDVILTTYSVVGSNTQERAMFRVLTLEYVVLDEAHMIKNMATLRYNNLMRINAKHRVLLTGTPLQNTLLELISLLIFVMPHMFAGKKEYLQSLFVSKTSSTASERKANKDAPRFEQAQVAQARRIMKPFVLRRLKSDVLKDLPMKVEETFMCPMATHQQEMYDELVQQYSRDSTIAEEDSIPPNGIAMMMQLRKLANHPALTQQHYTSSDLSAMAKYLSTDPLYKPTEAAHILEDLSEMSDFQLHQMSLTYKSLLSFKLPESVILGSGKFQKLDVLLPKLKSEGHRVLIFSQFVIMLDVLEGYLNIRKHSFLRLDGSTTVSIRQELINKFNDDPNIFVFLLSTRAGGLGINLTAADTVLLHDLDFNPYNDKQAEDRCHRMGQKRMVSVLRLISNNSIEEGIFQVAQEKLNLEREINSAEDGEPAEAKNVVRLLKQALGLNNKILPSAMKTS